MKLPEVVSEADWQAARERLLAKEKEATRARDGLAAERRRLPMVRIEKAYEFDGPAGKAALPDRFDGRRQLLIYHFMFGPNQDEGCDGCAMVIDNLGHPAHLHARDTTFAAVSRAPLAKIEPFKQRMGWDIPWFSSFDSDFNVDFGVSPETPQPTPTRTARPSGPASSSATATRSSAPTSAAGAGSRRWEATGPTST